MSSTLSAISRSKQKSLFRRSPNRLTTPTHRKPKNHPAGRLPSRNPLGPFIVLPMHIICPIRLSHIPTLANYLPYKSEFTGQQNHKQLHVQVSGYTPASYLSLKNSTLTVCQLRRHSIRGFSRMGCILCLFVCLLFLSWSLGRLRLQTQRGKRFAINEM